MTGLGPAGAPPPPPPVPPPPPSGFDRPRRLHPLSPVVRGARPLGAALVALLGSAIAAGSEVAASAGVLLVALALSAVVVVMRHLAFTWWIEGGRVHVREGVLARRHRTLPLARVQNVDLHEPVVARILGLAAVRIESAGGAGTDVVLEFVDRREAGRIHARIRPGPGGAPGRAGPARADRPDRDTLTTASLRDLLLAGATSNRAGLLAVAVAGLLGVADDLGLPLESRLLRVFRTLTGQDTVVLVALAVGLVAVTLVVGWLLSVAVTVLTFHGFTLRRHADELRREHGLLARYRATIPVGRIQALRVEEPWLRRLLGYVSLHVDTAGSPGQRGATGRPGAGRGVVSPLLAADEVAGIAVRVWPDLALGEVSLQRVHPLARRRGFVRLAVPAIVVGLGLMLLDPAWIGLLPVLLLLAWWWAGLRYRALAWAVADGHVLARAGVLTRRTWVVPVSRVQTVALRASPFQRRLGLATLSIDTAGESTGRVGVTDLGVDTARELLEELGRRSAATARLDAGL